MSTTTVTNQTPTILGPLTTAFTPPSGCTVPIAQTSGGLLDVLGLDLLGGSIYNAADLGKTCDGGKDLEATSCWPSITSGVSLPATPTGAFGLYSPGLSCPSGYASACSATGGSGGKSGWPVQFRLGDAETAVGCCPSGYACANINGQTCISTATSTVVPIVTCSGNQAVTKTSSTIPDTAASVTSFGFFAPMIQINWQSSDLLNRTTSFPDSAAATSTTASSSADSSFSAGGGGTTTLPGIVTNPGLTPGTSLIIAGSASGSQTGAIVLQTPATLPNNSITATSADGDSSPGLPVGARVGLGIAGGIAIIALVLVVVSHVWRRRRRAREDEEIDRLYGLKDEQSIAGSHHLESIPGWNRSQTHSLGFSPGSLRQMPRHLPPLPVDPFRGGTALTTDDRIYTPYRPGYR